jgi:hypothetical protein
MRRIEEKEIRRLSHLMLWLSLAAKNESRHLSVQLDPTASDTRGFVTVKLTASREHKTKQGGCHGNLHWLAANPSLLRAVRMLPVISDEELEGSSYHPELVYMTEKDAAFFETLDDMRQANPRHIVTFGFSRLKGQWVGYVERKVLGAVEGEPEDRYSYRTVKARNFPHMMAKLRSLIS